MPTRLALVHTVTGLVAQFKALCSEFMPGVDLFNVVDESLLQNAIREGGLSPITTRRVLGHLASAETAGASAILVTCSSIGPAVDQAAPFLGVPVLRVDEAMADEAIRIGSRVAVLATLRTTLDPTSDLIRRRADRAGRPIELSARVCEGAFEAVVRGDTERHDSLVGEALLEVASDADVVVLAQASMTRVLDSLPRDSVAVPVLSSPRLGVMRMARIMGLLAAEPAAEAAEV